MTASSARPSSVSESTPCLSAGEIGIWFCAGDASDSETFARELLARFTGLQPAQLEIHRGEYGKPFLVNAPRPLQFSLSHSGRWMACAVSAEVPLGVDLEMHDPKRDVMALARRFFRRPEQLELGPLEEGARVQRFYDLWTLKEARVKALGSSLGRELETTGFRIEDADCGLPVISTEPGPGDAFYCLLSALPGHSLALCSLAVQVRPPRISVARLLESGEDRAMSTRLIASSPC